MDTFKYKVVLEVEVDAFDSEDAEVAVEDTFGIGENLGIRVTNCEYKEARARRIKS